MTSRQADAQLCLPAQIGGLNDATDERSREDRWGNCSDFSVAASPANSSPGAASGARVVRRSPIMAPPGRHLNGILAMLATCESHPQPGLRRVLEAFKITTDEWKVTNDLAMSSHPSAERGGGKIVYLSDLRKRMDHGDEPSDPRPGAAAARPCELTFVQAVAAPEACAA